MNTRDSTWNSWDDAVASAAFTNVAVVPLDRDYWSDCVTITVSLYDAEVGRYQNPELYEVRVPRAWVDGVPGWWVGSEQEIAAALEAMYFALALAQLAPRFQLHNFTAASWRSESEYYVSARNIDPSTEDLHERVYMIHKRDYERWFKNPP